MDVGNIGIIRAADHAAGVRTTHILTGGEHYVALHRQILDHGVLGVASFHITKQTLVGNLGVRADIVDEQIADLVTLSIKGTGKLLAPAVHANRRPLETCQFNIVGQHSRDLGVASLVDLLGKPCQLRAAADLVDTVGVLGRLSGGLTVPCALGGLDQLDALGQLAVLHAGSIRRAQLAFAVIAHIAVLRDRVGVGAIAQLVGTILLRLDSLAIAALQDNSRAVHLAGLVGDVQLHVVPDLSGHGDLHIREVLEGEGHGNCVEVGALTGIGHVVHGAEGVGGGVHTAVHIAVCGGQNGFVLAVLKGDVLRDGEGNARGVHLLILPCCALNLFPCHGITGFESRGVKDAGDLVDRAVHAVEGQCHLVAGHDGLALVGGILHISGHSGDLHQLIAVLAVLIRHPDDNGAAVVVGILIHILERNGVCTLRSRQRGEVGYGAHHGCAVRQTEGVLHLHCVQRGKGHLGGGIRPQIIPCVVDIVPAGQTGIGFKVTVEGHPCLRLAQLVRHDKEIHAVGVGGGVETAMGRFVALVHVDGVIADGKHAGAAVGVDIRPVVAAVAAIDLRTGYLTDLVLRKRKGGGARQLRPDKVRLHHDITGVAVDQLPHAVGADALGAAAQRLGAGSTDKDLQVGLIALARLCAQLGKVMAELVGLSVDKVKAIIRILRHAGQPAALGHIRTGGICHAPGIVAVVLGNGINSRLGIIPVILPVDQRLLLCRIEVVVLEIKPEICRLRHGDGQLHNRFYLAGFGVYRVACRKRLVDLL